MERYIDPGREKACRLCGYLALGQSKGETNKQEVCNDIAYDNAVRIDIAIFLQKAIKVLELSERLGDP